MVEVFYFSLVAFASGQETRSKKKFEIITDLNFFDTRIKIYSTEEDWYEFNLS